MKMESAMAAMEADTGKDFQAPELESGEAFSDFSFGMSN
jgi:hypothetical protein